MISNKIRTKRAVFTTSNPRQALENELGYTHSTRQGFVINEIINEGLEIGLLEKLDPNTYKIKEAFSGPSLKSRSIRNFG